MKFEDAQRMENSDALRYDVCLRRMLEDANVDEEWHSDFKESLDHLIYFAAGQMGLSKQSFPKRLISTYNEVRPELSQSSGSTQFDIHVLGEKNVKLVVTNEKGKLESTVPFEQLRVLNHKIADAICIMTRLQVESSSRTDGID
jgi:hypothetical protein